MAGVDDVALLMPRSLGGRRLSTVAVDVSAFQALKPGTPVRARPAPCTRRSVSRRARVSIRSADADAWVAATSRRQMTEEAPPRATSRLTALRRGAGSSRTGTATKHVFVFKPWCVAPVTPRGVCRTASNESFPVLTLHTSCRTAGRPKSLS